MVFIQQHIGLFSIILIQAVILTVAFYAVIQRTHTSLRLWGSWTLLVVAGFAVGTIIGAPLAYTTANDPLGVLVFAIAVGFSQWLILRKFLHRSVYWISATATGLFAVIAACYYEGWLWLLFSLIVGAAQVHVLGQQYRGAIWWILASSLGLIGWLLLGSALNPLLDIIDEYLLDLLLAVTSGIYGGVTGLALVLILKRPIISLEDLPKSVTAK